MSKLNIIYQNLADTAVITANTTASGFAISNVQNTQKTSVHRTTGNTAIYTLNWSTLQSIDGIALPATNLQAGATIRAQAYSDSALTTLVADTGIKQACQNRNTVLFGKSSTPTYVDFGFGGSTKTSLWFNNTVSAKVLVITVTNANPIDCARIVCGPSWESTRQVNRGIDLSFNDLSEVTTTRSGNSYVDRKPIIDSLRFDLEYFTDADRIQLLNILRSWGSNGNIYVCVFPDNTNPELTQAYSIYGRNQGNSLQYQYYGLYSSSLDITSW